MTGIRHLEEGTGAPFEGQTIMPGDTIEPQLALDLAGAGLKSIGESPQISDVLVDSASTATDRVPGAPISPQMLGNVRKFLRPQR